MRYVRRTEFIPLTVDIDTNPKRQRGNELASSLKSSLTLRVSVSGMTLVELLVVLAIVLLLAAATIPRLKPEIDRSRIREAARSIQLYLSSARNQAIATGHSCGVQIERLAAENGCSMALTQVESPVRYGGDTLNSIATVAPSQGPISGYAYCKIALSSPPSVPLYPGDQIQIGYQGFWITLATQNTTNPSTGAITSSPLIGYVDITHGETPPWTIQQISGPYSIIRWPTKSVASPLQLPSPACIDLTWSGVDQVLPADPLTWPIANTPVTIMFAPNGSVDQIYATVGGTYSAKRATSAIYLLVGRRDEVINPLDATNTTSNIYDLTSLWVAINAQTGMIVVTDNAQCTPPPPAPPATYSGGSTATTCLQTRQFARQSDAMGGK